MIAVISSRYKVCLLSYKLYRNRTDIFPCALLPTSETVHSLVEGTVLLRNFSWDQINRLNSQIQIHCNKPEITIQKQSIIFTSWNNLLRKNTKIKLHTFIYCSVLCRWWGEMMTMYYVLFMEHNAGAILIPGQDVLKWANNGKIKRSKSCHIGFHGKRKA